MIAASAKEHRREMDVLHLKALRPPRNGGDPDSPYAANYDEALANPYPRPSDVLRRNDGKETATPAQWWRIRRPQIAAAFDEDIYGHPPKATPPVKWEVADTKTDVIGGVKAITKKLVGHVDNAGDPAITVNIEASETLPADVKGRVPVIIELTFDFSKFHFPKGFKLPPEPPGPDWKTQILRLGWGYVTYDPTSVQPDNGAGLAEGIVGLANKGEPRKMDDWGALRAWAWGASRILDYLKTEPHVAGDEIGIAGHSRYGKAALVAEAFDQRFAIGYISSSGAGGAKLLRRNYGETVANIAGDEFHWMAGNFLRYAADPLTPNDLPVDADALIALCAPRPVFISAGSPEAGDAWVDARGMFMAAAGAGPVYRLLGKKGLETDIFPPMGTTLISGDVGFRQHHYGHTQAPNWPVFLKFARKYLHAEKS
ncbi:MAG: acetylxylan esterase [Alphaproteobacteria bacterium]|nr:acetylxylan esterase [Alphaproteobacteria bacterium]MDE2112406.1 acetylxylan esterase [Alphaproteobacteria bacterium]MDE2495331.1 acetylxylan esterase [Alphaproteobacteria bacterium]